MAHSVFRSWAPFGRCVGLAGGVVGFACALTPATGQPAAPACPNPPAVIITSPHVPRDVCIPSELPFSADQIAFFDDYSWRSFIAVAWPAAKGQRGVPDSTQTVGDGGPRVFETLKAMWEVFHGGTAPSPWSSFDDVSPCGWKIGFDDLVIASVSKFGEIGQPGLGELVGPLIAQNRTYVRYSTGFNEVVFNEIVRRQLYVRSHQPRPPATLSLPTNSLVVKSAWMEIANATHPERYYTRQAWLPDLSTSKCKLTKVGLVGLHIVQKTATRPQWIWSTFEHVDNVPPATPGAPGTFAFNAGNDTPMPGGNEFSVDPPPIPPPSPFNVERLRPIHLSTRRTNVDYQTALEKMDPDGKWKFYQLVLTQWPKPPDPAQPIPPQMRGTPDHTRPGGGTATSFANTVMETFSQVHIDTGCMNCHTATQAQTDFLWSLKLHAFSPDGPAPLFQDRAVQDLKALIQRNLRR